MRTPKELLIASREFTGEKPWLSRWHLGSTLAILVALIAVAVADLPWGLRLAASLVAGLVGVRVFIFYHDFQHSAIFRDSLIVRWLMNAYGILMLNPPSVWNRSHDHHHKNNSKTFGASIGSFPIMTTEGYATATRAERFTYFALRHPLTILLGYFSVFLWGMSLRPFVNSPKRHWDGGLAVIVHFILLVGLFLIGWQVALFGFIIPTLVSSALGAYLFYAQHNYPTAQLQPRSEWSHVHAALHASSYITMNPLMHWFTGNIGYHHVHHLNSRIPFYRLPEAMAALEELQSPGTTSLTPRAIAACLRLKLWCPNQGKFVGYNGV